MATRGYIGYIQDGKVFAVYSHLDNGTLNNGAVLHWLYRNPSTIKKFIDKMIAEDKHIHILGSTVEKSIVCDSNGLVDMLVGKELSGVLEQFEQSMIRCVYLFDLNTNKWNYAKCHYDKQFRPTYPFDTKGNTQAHIQNIDEMLDAMKENQYKGCEITLD